MYLSKYILFGFVPMHKSLSGAMCADLGVNVAGTFHLGLGGESDDRGRGDIYMF
jgi:hypothetical protein